MSKWIKLLDEAPTKQDMYRCLCLDYNQTWMERFLWWTQNDGFQPDTHGQRDAYAVNMNVTHWLKTEELEAPIEEAKGLIIETEVFFGAPYLEEFAEQNNIERYERYGNATEYIVSGVPESVLMEMRTMFKSNGVSFNVRKR